MTRAELKKSHELICTVISVAAQLEQYYKDYHNLTIKSLADDLRQAAVKFQKR